MPWPFDHELQQVLLCCENAFSRCGRGIWVLITMFFVFAFALSAFSDSLLAHQTQIGLTDEQIPASSKLQAEVSP